MQYAEMEEVYRRWCREATEDTDVALELKQMEQDPEKIEDAFYRSLSFGTGGLRGLIGVTIKPRRCRQSSDRSQVSLPTESYTTRTFLPPVISFNRSTRFSSR